MQLRTRLVNSIESNLKFCELKVISNHHESSIRYSVIRFPSEKGLFRHCVVTARLLIMVKHTATFY